MDKGVVLDKSNYKAPEKSRRNLSNNLGRVQDISIVTMRVATTCNYVVATFLVYMGKKDEVLN